MCQWGEVLGREVLPWEVVSSVDYSIVMIILWIADRVVVGTSVVSGPEVTDWRHET